MRNDAGILIAEDDDGHYSLIERNLFRSGINNEITRFRDGQGAVEFLTNLKDADNPKAKQPWLAILDIRMPKVDGLEVLRLIKNDSRLKVIPVIMLTTASNDQLIEQCHEIGCNVFVVKPIEYDDFVASMTQIGRFLSIVEIPSLCA
ncbi:MAG: response regulator [Planctomycetota bacterium]|jgi:CheY-like chemotaxis protein